MGRGGEEAAHLEALAPSSIRHLLAENEVARALNPARVLIRLPLKRERFDREHRGVGEANSPATVPATIGSLGLADVLNRSFGDARDLGGAVVGELALEDVERGNACKDARNVKSMYVEERNRRRLPTCGCTLGVAVLDHDVAWGDGQRARHPRQKKTKRRRTENLGRVDQLKDRRSPDKFVRRKPSARVLHREDQVDRLAHVLFRHELGYLPAS